MKAQKLFLLLACFAIFFEAFDVSIVNLSLVAIANDMGISIAGAQWVQTIYLITFGGFLLLGGRLCDYAGPKRIYLWGMFVFGAGSLGAFISNNFSLLLLARTGQGLGAAMSMPAGIMILTTYFKEGPERNNAMGIFGSFAAFGFGLGLALGGIITRYFDWHWVFGINVPIFVLILLTAYKALPADPLKRKQGINIVSSAWLCASLLILCYSIHELPSLGWFAPAGILLSVFSLLIMTQYDRRLQQPFFKTGLITNASWKAQAGSLLLGAGFLSYVFLATRALTICFNMNIRDTGFLLLPFSIASALVSKYLLPGIFIRIGIKRTALLSISLLFAGATLLLLAVNSASLALALISVFMINSFAIAIGYPALTILAVSGVRTGDQGSAAGLQSCLYTMGSSIGLSVTGLCLQLLHVA